MTRIYPIYAGPFGSPRARDTRVFMYVRTSAHAPRTLVRIPGTKTHLGSLYSRTQNIIPSFNKKTVPLITTRPRKGVELLKWGGGSFTKLR